MLQVVRIVAHANKSGNLSIRLRCYVMSRYVDIATGIVVAPSDWDNRRQRVKPTNDDSKQLNARLGDLSDRATLYLQSNSDPTIDGLRAVICPISAAADTYTSDDLFSALDAFIAAESRRNTWSDGTRKRFISLRASLFEFSPSMHLSSLTASTLDRYIVFRSSHGYKNTTIHKDIKLIRWFLNWCNTEGLYSGDLHRSYMPRLKGANYEYKEVIYLTLEELQSVEHADLPKHLATVRDVFVFCCYTGLRFSDAAALRRSDVYSNCIEIVTQKTDKRIRIELNKHAATILERYASIDYPDGRALPAISNQQTNKYLKQICRFCNIDSPTSVVAYSGNKRIESTVPKYELITTHCARRTFVVTALQLGIPIEVITRWTGHGDIKSLKPYVAIVDSLKAAQMAKFNTL